MSQRLPLTIRLEQFEGPLDLLLFLIQDRELDISTVSLGKITDQYLIYIQHMIDLNFDVASDFLVMAATLIMWKSKALLPKEESEAQAATEDQGPTPEQLILQMLERKRFLEASGDLSRRPKLGEEVFTRPHQKPPLERVWREMNISDMALSYQEMLLRARKRNQVLKKETVSVADKVLYFADRLELGVMTEMKALLSAMPSKGEWVVTFLTSLELARLKKLKVYQNLVYDPIYLELIEELKGNPTSLVNDLQTFTETPQPL